MFASVGNTSQASMTHQLAFWTGILKCYAPLACACEAVICNWPAAGLCNGADICSQATHAFGVCITIKQVLFIQFLFMELVPASGNLSAVCMPDSGPCHMANLRCNQCDVSPTLLRMSLTNIFTASIKSPFACRMYMH